MFTVQHYKTINKCIDAETSKILARAQLLPTSSIETCGSSATQADASSDDPDFLSHCGVTI